MTIHANPAENQSWEAAKAATVAGPELRLITPTDDRSLHADRDMMRDFLLTVFKHCADTRGWLVLRAFEHKSERVCLNTWTPFAKSFVDEAAAAATEIARRDRDRRAVFSPPVCVFGDETTKDGKRFSGDSNVICAPAIAVDLDKYPVAGLVSLWGVLGQPTVIVATGGKWEGEDRLHAYWRLYDPARTEPERALLKQAREMASKLVDGDGSAASLSHAMRWPGSWHTKGEPVLCRLTDGGDPSRDIDLHWALDELAKALAAKGVEWEGRSGFAGPGTGQFKTKEPLPPETLLDAARIIPNADLGWDTWNTTLMTFYDASHGSIDGYEAASVWSQKSSKYSPEGVEELVCPLKSGPP